MLNHWSYITGRVLYNALQVWEKISTLSSVGIWSFGRRFVSLLARAFLLFARLILYFFSLCFIVFCYAFYFSVMLNRTKDLQRWLNVHRLFRGARVDWEADFFRASPIIEHQFPFSFKLRKVFSLRNSKQCGTIWIPGKRT